MCHITHKDADNVQCARKGELISPQDHAQDLRQHSEIRTGSHAVTAQSVEMWFAILEHQPNLPCPLTTCSCLAPAGTCGELWTVAETQFTHSLEQQEANRLYIEPIEGRKRNVVCATPPAMNRSG